MSYYSMVRSKHEIDPDDPEGSLEKNRIFRATWSKFFLYSLIGIQLIFSYINLAILGIVENMKTFNYISIAFSILVSIVCVYISIKLGQGGDRIVLDGDKLRSGYNIEDDEQWIFGNTVYYNPQDSAIFVEKRVGVGWTVNMGRFLGKFLLIAPFILIIGTVILMMKLS